MEERLRAALPQTASSPPLPALPSSLISVHVALSSPYLDPYCSVMFPTSSKSQASNDLCQSKRFYLPQRPSGQRWLSEAFLAPPATLKPENFGYECVVLYNQLPWAVPSSSANLLCPGNTPTWHNGQEPHLLRMPLGIPLKVGVGWGRELHRPPQIPWPLPTLWEAHLHTTDTLASVAEL